MFKMIGPTGTLALLIINTPEWGQNRPYVPNFRINSPFLRGILELVLYRLMAQKTLL